MRLTINVQMNSAELELIEHAVPELIDGLRRQRFDAAGLLVTATGRTVPGLVTVDGFHPQPGTHYRAYLVDGDELDLTLIADNSDRFSIGGKSERDSTTLELTVNDPRQPGALTITMASRPAPTTDWLNGDFSGVVQLATPLKFTLSHSGDPLGSGSLVHRRIKARLTLRHHPRPDGTSLLELTIRMHLRGILRPVGALIAPLLNGMLSRKLTQALARLPAQLDEQVLRAPDGSRRSARQVADALIEQAIGSLGSPPQET